MNFRVGSSGDEIVRLQKDLNILGEKLKVTGSFDNLTASAVQRFQKKIGKQIDGVVSDSLLKLIIEKAAFQRPKLDFEAPRVDTQQGVGIWEGFSTSRRPGIQVLMTARNASSFVGRALNSLETALRQSDWVLVFVDDGSEDQTYAVAADRESSSSARVFRRRKASSSIGAARNVLLQLGKEFRHSHSLVYFFDADDVASPDLVGALFDPMMLNGNVAAFGSYQLLAPQFPAENGTVVTAEAENQVEGSMPIGSVAFHSSLIPEDSLLFDEAVSAHEDGSLWVRWFKSGVAMSPIKGVPVCQCSRRVGSVSCPQNAVARDDLARQWTEKRINIMEANLARPLVSALMLTGKCAEREAMARIAVRCFLNQTWPNKQLVIINHGKYTLANGDPRVKEVKLDRPEDMTLGDLRNRSIDESEGDWLIQWDDDDWHHPGRIEAQMEFARHDALVTFLWQIRLNLLNETAFYDRMDDGQHMSILFSRKLSYRYMPLDIREDTEFKRNFKSVHAIDNSVLNPRHDPLMYVRTFHGNNIWDVSHVMGGSQAKYDPDFSKIDLLGYHADRIRQIIKTYRAEADRLFAPVLPVFPAKKEKKEVHKK
jgi:glycosyltransferase involved in cell wall biosynthesis